jgi:hypothetical protein
MTPSELAELLARMDEPFAASEDPYAECAT